MNFIKGCLLFSMIGIPRCFALERVALGRKQFLLSRGTKGNNKKGEQGRQRNGAGGDRTCTTIVTVFKIKISILTRAIFTLRFIFHLNKCNKKLFILTCSDPSWLSSVHSFMTVVLLLSVITE